MAKNLGKVTAYAHAKAGGYTGTEAEFNAMLAGLDEYNEAAAQSAEEASGYAEEASGYVTEASGYADNASASASAALEILGRLHGSERARYWKHYDVTTQTTDFAFNPTNYSYTTGDDYDVYVNGEMLNRDKVMIHTASYGGGYNVTIIIDGGISGAGNPDEVDIFCYKNITLSTDDTLTEQGAAADAKKTGDEIDALKDDLSNIQGISDDVKVALLACFEKVAWIDEHGQDYYDALYDALYEEPPTPSFEYGVYEPESIINGKYIDATGAVADGEANKSFYIEDYIPVVKGSYWIGYQPPRLQTDSRTIWSESNWRVSEYDNNKQFIKQTHYAGSESVGAKSASVITFEQNTKYIRFGFYDAYNQSSSPNHVFDIEDPATITELPMEQGDIDISTGQNSERAIRIRTVGYIPMTETITLAGCPFAPTWESINPYCAIGVRCYDSNKNYLGSVPDMPVTDTTKALLANTAYIRMIMQIEQYNFSSYANMVGYLYTINGTKYYLT